MGVRRCRPCESSTLKLVRPRSNDSKRDSRIQSELDAAVIKMHEFGAIICDPVDIPSSGQWKEKKMSDEITMNMHEFREDMREYLMKMKRTDVANVRDIVE
jgi:hypothetical protein